VDQYTDRALKQLDGQVGESEYDWAAITNARVNDLAGQIVALHKRPNLIEERITDLGWKVASAHARINGLERQLQAIAHIIERCGTPLVVELLHAQGLGRPGVHAPPAAGDSGGSLQTGVGTEPGAGDRGEPDPGVGGEE
jgi:hypothetical protein